MNQTTDLEVGHMFYAVLCTTLRLYDVWRYYFQTHGI